MTAKKKSKTAKIINKFYQNKALLFIASFGLVGAVLFTTVFAFSNPTNGAYVWNASGIYHNVGEAVPNFGINVGGDNLIRTVWDDYTPNGHYMWYGPYATVVWPSSYGGLNVCWQYSTDINGKQAIFDVTSNNGANTLVSRTLTLQASHIVYQGGVKYYQLQTYCTTIYNNSLSSQTISNLEIRVKALNTGNLWMYKTLWQLQ